MGTGLGIGVLALVIVGGIAPLALVLVLWGSGAFNGLTRGRIGAQGACS